MEVKTNSYYKAVYILCFIFASLLVVTCLLGILGVSMSNEMFAEMYQEYLNQVGDPDLALAYVNSVKVMTYVLFVIGLICAGMTYAEGGIFVKLSKMDDKTAYEKYNFALAWVIVSFFFCGILIAGLALAGLLAVQKKQKENYLAGNVGDVNVQPQTQTNDVNVASGVPAQTKPACSKNEPDYSLENMEKVRDRLVKLQEIKDLGAINDEEYATIRAEIMQSITPKPEKKEEQAPVVDPVAEQRAKRLAKLDELKAVGAITEEEYEKLKAKVENE